MAAVSQDAETVRRLRRGIGVIGLALPFVLTIGHMLFAGRVVLLGSISGYYYTEMRDVFVGAMSAMGVFLICYRYAKPDDTWSMIAGVLAIAVAVFHTTDDRKLPVSANDKVIGMVHAIAAASLLIVMAVFCLFLFTRTAPGRVTTRKRVRNGIYYVTGGAIVVSLLLAVASRLFLSASTRDDLRVVLWVEVVAVLSFGIAWMVKGETILRDPPA